MNCQVVVPAHLRVAAEVEEVGGAAEALEGAGAQGQQPRGADPHVVAGVGVEGLARQGVAELRRDLVGEPHRVARRAGRSCGRRSSPARRRCPAGPACRCWNSVPPVQLLLVVVGRLLQGRVVVRLALVDEAGRHLDAAVRVERVDAEDRAAVDRLRRLRVGSAQEARVGRVVQDAAELTVVEQRLREALRRVLEAVRQVDVREGELAVLRDRRGVDVELMVAEHVAEGDGRAAEDVAAARHADVDRRPPSRNSLPKVLFLLIWLLTSVWVSGAWKSMIGPGAPKSALAAVRTGVLGSIV